MSFSTPSIELNLYKVEILRDIPLTRDGGRPIEPNYNDSPFMNPEIYPSTRVGRWESVPNLENYVELDYGQMYKIKLHNYTWTYCLASIIFEGRLIGEWPLKPRSHVVINGPKTGYSYQFGSDRPQFEANQSTFLQPNEIDSLSNGFQFTKYGTQSDMIEVHFKPEQWTERTSECLMTGGGIEGNRNTIKTNDGIARVQYDPIFQSLPTPHQKIDYRSCPPPLFTINRQKETIIYVRLVCRRVSDVYQHGPEFRSVMGGSDTYLGLSF